MSPHTSSHGLWGSAHSGTGSPASGSHLKAEVSVSARAPVSSQGSTGEGSAFQVHGIVDRIQVLDLLDSGLQVPAGCQLKAALVPCKGRLLLHQNRQRKGLPGRHHSPTQRHGNALSSLLLFSIRSTSLVLLTPEQETVSQGPEGGLTGVRPIGPEKKTGNQEISPAVLCGKDLGKTATWQLERRGLKSVRPQVKRIARKSQLEKKQITCSKFF